MSGVKVNWVYEMRKKSRQQKENTEAKLTGGATDGSREMVRDEKKNFESQKMNETISE